jgi:thiamine-phosphate pyrophosphorylase
MGFRLPRVYPILDSSFIAGTGSERASFLLRLGTSLADAGVALMEYRNKQGTDAEALADAQVMRSAMPDARLVLDDRVDVAMAVGFDGVHVDSGDLPVEAARRLMGADAIIGTSASSEEQLIETLGSGADYVAFGPVFPTTTKQTSAAPIGIEGVRSFRRVAGPGPLLVAAAGITLETAPAILEAGANSVAVSAAIFSSDDPAAEFRRWIALLA